MALIKVFGVWCPVFGGDLNRLEGEYLRVAYKLGAERMDA
jgi:hypothetical protein